MDKETAFELYKLFRGEMRGSFELHRAALQHYLTFSVAVLAATIAGALRLEEVPWLGVVLVVVPILNIFICMTAISVCGRYFNGAMERITIVAKLEKILGLHGSVGGTPLGFEQDDYLLPERWLEITARFQSSKDFVDSWLNLGVNKLARRSFFFLILLNALLALSILWFLVQAIGVRGA
ncbi:MAG: hypothetical protein GY856_38065 [bacterium]|nr:hypothetical protein [bacterium]